MISVRSLAFLILSLVACNLPATAQDSSKPLFDGSTPPELLWNEGEFTEGVAAAPNGQIFFNLFSICFVPTERRFGLIKIVERFGKRMTQGCEA